MVQRSSEIFPGNPTYPLQRQRVLTGPHSSSLWGSLIQVPYIPLSTRPSHISAGMPFGIAILRHTRHMWSCNSRYWHHVPLQIWAAIAPQTPLWVRVEGVWNDNEFRVRSFLVKVTVFVTFLYHPDRYSISL